MFITIDFRRSKKNSLNALVFVNLLYKIMRKDIKIYILKLAVWKIYSCYAKFLNIAQHFLIIRALFIR